MSGLPLWTCSDCGSEISGRVYLAGWWGAHGHGRCEACEMKLRAETNEERSLEGSWSTCDVCQREISRPRQLSDRRGVKWCGHPDCHVEAVRLSKRVPRELRPCERCGKPYRGKRGARFCSDVCRALASRERAASGSGSEGREPGAAAAVGAITPGTRNSGEDA